MKKFVTLSLLFTLTAVVFSNTSAQAITAGDWRAGRIEDDVILPTKTT